MRSINLLISSVVITFMIVGCTDKNLTPVEPIDQNSTESLNKEVQVVHSIQGSALGTYEGKTFGGRITANEYNDGSFDGEIKVNAVLFSPELNMAIKVLSFKIYENIGEYGGKMGVLLGKIKTGAYAGAYSLIYIIDNGVPGQTNAPDQFRLAMTLESEDFQIPADWETPFTGLTILDFYTMSPEDLILNFGIYDCNKGNITVE